MAPRIERPIVQTEPPKHVIAEYRHREQMVTCVCGWHGSSATGDANQSPWSSHVAVHRPTKR